MGGGQLTRAEIQRQNRRLAAIRLDLKRPIRKKYVLSLSYDYDFIKVFCFISTFCTRCRTAPKIKGAAKLRGKYAKERFARKDDPKDDGASGAAAVN